MCFDFAFAKTTREDKDYIQLTQGRFATCGVWVDMDTNYVRSIPFPSKEASAYPIRTGKGFLERLRLPTFRARSDPEAAAQKVLGETRKLLPTQLRIEATPLHSSQSNPSERHIQNVEKVIRTHRMSVQERYGLDFGADHCGWP